MTDKMRTEKTYAKIREKYPHITNKDEIDNLAIKLEKRIIIYKSLGFLAGAVVSFLVTFIAETGDTRFYLYCLVALCIFEGFHTFSKYSKAEKLYKPVLNVNYEGCLARERILEDGKKIFKKYGEDFVLYKLPLFDMEDTVDDNAFVDMKHIYLLEFTHPESNEIISVKTKSDVYMNAVIGTEYYVAVTPSGIGVAAYQATNWSIDPMLGAYFRNPQPMTQGVNMQYPAAAVPVMQQPVPNNYVASNIPAVPNPMYSPAKAQINDVPVQTQKVLPVTAFILTAVAAFTPAIIAIPATVAAVVVSAIGLAKQRSKLAIASFIISLIFAAIMTVGTIILMIE